MKKALITGITGQDGSYLAELLLGMDYEVHGLIRRSSSFNTTRIYHIFDRLHLHHGDLQSGSNLARIVHQVQPDEIYNLGAQSHVKVSFDSPEYAADVTGTGVVRLIEAARAHAPNARIYQASSSEMFGKVQEIPQTEKTPFYPRSPYGCAKVYAFNIARNYREAYGMHISNGILFNHESERRGETFVTRKITRAVARIAHGLQPELRLGNLDAKRDWGYAPDFVRAMWLMLQQQHPDDYVIATGETHTVAEFLMKAFDLVGLNWREYVVVDPCYFRPTEVDLLLGDSTKAEKKLGWKPETSFSELVKLMVRHDIRLVEKELHGSKPEGIVT
jgi:GDPmannose 4,6-dehydratase